MNLRGSPDPQFEDLLRRVRSGCSDAACELFERYHDVIRNVVRQRLHRRLRSQFDSLDFVQSAWASFIQVPLDRYQFDSPQQLVGFLSRIAYSKIIDAFRQKVHAAKYGSGRERLVPPGPAEAPDQLDVANPRQPTPSQVAIADEHWERLMEGQPPQVCQVLEMLRDGHTHHEIAERLQLHPKMIQRLLGKLRRSRLL